MKDLVYPRERTFATITLVLGLLIWLALIAGTFGVALLMLVIGFIAYLFVQSALISHIKGHGVELSPTQFPDLHEQFSACCERLQLGGERPRAYVMAGNGALNAFASQFLGTRYVVLLSDVVDAMARHPDGVRFYIGHELGHLRMKHLGFGHLLRWPALWLPLLGGAYSRARESTCDRHGLACSSSGENAARALAALSAGTRRWALLDLEAFRRQASQSSGFWMSFHELIAAYPWLTKRAARVMDPEAPSAGRNPFAYLLALFVPFAGRLGGGFGFLMMVYLVGVLAAVAIPQYKDYTVKAKLSQVVVDSQATRDALGSYYEANKAVPASLEEIRQPAQLRDGSRMQLNAKSMVLTIGTPQGELVFEPRVDDQGRIRWNCMNGEGLLPSQVPSSCAAKR